MSQQKQSENLYRVIHKEGAHIASSNDTDGAFRGNLLDDDTNKPVGNAEWVKVNVNEYDYMDDYQETTQEVELSPEAQEFAQFLGEMIVAGTSFVLSEVVAPRVKHWWQDKAMPTLKGKWNGVTEKKKEKQAKKRNKKTQGHTTEIVTTSGTVPGMFSQELDEVYEKYVNDMTSKEAQRELLEIFILSAMLTAKIKKLSNARIIKDGSTPGEYIEGQETIERLTTPEYIASINCILENNLSLLEEKSATLSAIMGRSLISNGQYIPIENDKFKEKLMM